MQKYIKNYMKHHGYSPGEYIPCEICQLAAVDIHHILYRSQGGSDDVDNLIGLCRSCHEEAHKTNNKNINEKESR